MKMRMFNLLFAIGSISFAGAAAQAQTYDLVARIPFAFHANGADQPAGVYRITRSATSGAQYLLNEATGRSYSLTIGVPTERGNGASRLLFDRLGEHYFLTEIWSSGGSGTKLPMQKMERDLRASAAAQPLIKTEIYLAAK